MMGYGGSFFKSPTPPMRELALEVLSTFELALGTIAFHPVDYIQFLVFGSLHRISLNEFSIHLSLYDTKFTHTTAYDALFTFRPAREPLNDAW